MSPGLNAIALDWTAFDSSYVLDYNIVALKPPGERDFYHQDTKA
jgi:hypothetical protein